MKTVKYVVTGKVQGVWFRASTQKQAQRLGLTGYAHNLPSGQVEIKATGDAQQHEALLAYLHQGPELAEVSQVEVEASELVQFTDFTTG